MAFDWSQLKCMTKVEFIHSGGDFGLHYDGNIVVKVEDQAKRLGVKPGWKVAMIDGQVVKSGGDVFERLQEAKWQWRSCVIYFCTYMKQIRSEQNAKRQQEVKAELERLAKLPFADSADPKHMEQVKEFLTFKGYIDHREDRAITLPQFKMTLQWSAEHCHRWRDADPPELSKTSRMHLNMNFMNMYHLTHWLIKPSTLEKDCSFVEILTSAKQPAEWFVVSWWGDRLKDLLTCMELQATTRELGEDTGFWLGAFACRPHSFHDDVGVNPESTCYFRAMRQAKFHVLLVLDAKSEHSGPATPFKRAWCGYEMSMCLGMNENNTVLDIVTSEGLRPAIITHGLTKAERSHELVDPGSGYRMKAEREKSFSMEVIALALNIHVQSGSTLRPRDKQRVLNSIAQRDLEEKPLPQHESYTRYNQRLRALFALAFWRRVMSVSGEQSETQQLQQKMAQAIKGDEWRTSLDLSFAFMTGSGSDVDEKIALAMRNLPSQLKHLSIDLSGADISNDTLAEISKNLPKGLEVFNLNLCLNPKVDNNGVETMVGKLPQNVCGCGIAL
jgi:hypothetical protein